MAAKTPCDDELIEAPAVSMHQVMGVLAKATKAAIVDLTEGVEKQQFSFAIFTYMLAKSLPGSPAGISALIKGIADQLDEDIARVEQPTLDEVAARR